MPKLTMPWACARLHDLLVEAALVLRRHPDLIAEIAGIGDAVDERRAHCAISIGRWSMNLKAALDTSSSVSCCSTSRDFGPAMERPDQPHVVALDLHRCRRWADAARTSACDTSAPGSSPTCRSSRPAALAMVKSPISLPCGLSIGVSTRRPVFGILLVMRRDRKASAPGAGEAVLGEVGDLGDADAVARAPAPPPSHAGSHWSGGRRRCPSAPRPWARTTAASPGPSCRP